MQQGQAVISPELSSFLSNAIATVVFYGTILLVAGIVFAAVRIMFAGDDADLKHQMKGMLMKLVVAAFLLVSAYPLGNWLLQLAGQS